MPDMLGFVVISLATWRVVCLFQDEKGPGDILLQLRKLLGISHDAEDIPVGWPENFVGKLFSCFWCMSLWIGGGMYIAWRHVPMLPTILAVSAGAILFEETVRRLKNG